jgi:hypothetical protein
MAAQKLLELFVIIRMVRGPVGLRGLSNAVDTVVVGLGGAKLPPTPGGGTR